MQGLARRTSFFLLAEAQHEQTEAATNVQHNNAVKSLRPASAKLNNNGGERGPTRAKATNDNNNTIDNFSLLPPGPAASSSSTAVHHHALSRHDLIMEEDLPRVVEAYFAVDEHRQMFITVSEGEEAFRLIGLKPDRSALLRGQRSQMMAAPQAVSSTTSMASSSAFPPATSHYAAAASSPSYYQTTSILAGSTGRAAVSPPPPPPLQETVSLAISEETTATSMENSTSTAKPPTVRRVNFRTPHSPSNHNNATATTTVFVSPNPKSPRDGLTPPLPLSHTSTHHLSTSPSVGFVDHSSSSAQGPLSERRISIYNFLRAVFPSYPRTVIERALESLVPAAFAEAIRVRCAAENETFSNPSAPVNSNSNGAHHPSMAVSGSSPSTTTQRVQRQHGLADHSQPSSVRSTGVAPVVVTEAVKKLFLKCIHTQLDPPSSSIKDDHDGRSHSYYNNHRVAQSDSDALTGTISFAQLVACCPGADVEQLGILALKASSPVVSLRALDDQRFRQLRLSDLFRHAGLPASHLLSLKTIPPLSMANLLTYWDVLRPQLTPQLAVPMQARLAQLVVFLRRYGPKAAFRVKWSNSLTQDTSPHYDMAVEIGCGVDFIPRNSVSVDQITLNIRQLAVIMQGVPPPMVLHTHHLVHVTIPFDDFDPLQVQPFLCASSVNWIRQQLIVMQTAAMRNSVAMANKLRLAEEGGNPTGNVTGATASGTGRRMSLDMSLRGNAAPLLGLNRVPSLSSRAIESALAAQQQQQQQDNLASSWRVFSSPHTPRPVTEDEWTEGDALALDQIIGGDITTTIDTSTAASFRKRRASVPKANLAASFRRFQSSSNLTLSATPKKPAAEGGGLLQVQEKSSRGSNSSGGDIVGFLGNVVESDSSGSEDGVGDDDDGEDRSFTSGQRRSSGNKSISRTGTEPSQSLFSFPSTPPPHPPAPPPQRQQAGGASRPEAAPRCHNDSIHQLAAATKIVIETKFLESDEEDDDEGSRPSSSDDEQTLLRKLTRNRSHSSSADAHRKSLKPTAVPPAGCTETARAKLQSVATSTVIPKKRKEGHCMQSQRPLTESERKQRELITKINKVFVPTYQREKEAEGVFVHHALAGKMVPDLVVDLHGEQSPEHVVLMPRDSSARPASGKVGPSARRPFPGMDVTTRHLAGAKTSSPRRPLSARTATKTHSTAPRPSTIAAAVAAHGSHRCQAGQFNKSNVVHGCEMGSKEYFHTIVSRPLGYLGVVHEDYMLRHDDSD